MELTCPKCQGPMRNYERSGIFIDQCAECRGIFLDRGELEKLVDAETEFHQAPAQAAPQAAPSWGTPERPRYEEPYRGRDDRHRDYDDRHRDDDDRHRYDQRYGDPRYGDPRYGKKKKRSFLEELFD